ncbi:hypothetical protein ACJ41O_000513 [Fusarium nematophilum]
MAAVAKPAAVPKVLPILMVVGSCKSPPQTSMSFTQTNTNPPVAVVASFVRSQLAITSAKFDHSFDKYNTPESEASRKKTFEGAQENPRTSLYNILGRRQ